MITVPHAPAGEVLRVLVVDDSEAQRNAVRRELSDMNVEIEEAPSGWAALKKAATFEPHLITLDIEMSELDGYRVLKQLRAQEKTRGVPVIMISGSPNEEERFRALEDGAIAYFSKPFPAGALRSLVSGIVERVARNREAVVWCVTEQEAVRERLSRVVLAQGYQFRALRDTRELMERLSSMSCDVLLIDLHLQQQGAYRVLDHLNLCNEDARPRVMGLMSGAPPADFAQAFHRGLSDFVREPYCAEELDARIEHMVFLRRKNADLKALALLDTLTRLPNRAQLEQDVLAAKARTIHAKAQLGVVMIDVDHFKRLNDTFGHPFGDHVLREVGTSLRDCLRANDVIGRYGGEEFMMLVPNANPAGIRIVAERLRQNVEGLMLQREGQRVPVTVSVGTCIWDYTALLGLGGIGDLVKPADAALYQAKRAGRNRIGTGETVVA